MRVPQWEKGGTGDQRSSPSFAQPIPFPRYLVDCVGARATAWDHRTTGIAGAGGRARTRWAIADSIRGTVGTVACPALESKVAVVVGRGGKVCTARDRGNRRNGETYFSSKDGFETDLLGLQNSHCSLRVAVGAVWISKASQLQIAG